MNAPILLSGPPGAGKSTVGRALAARLGVPGVDLDDAILARTRRTPAAIIREQGEPAFRDVEADTLESLDAQYRVVSLGGGTLTTPRGRRAARAKGAVFGLEADAGTLTHRLGASEVDRPLLASPGAIGALMEARHHAYAAVDAHVDARPELDRIVDAVTTRLESLALLHAELGDQTTRVLIGEDLAEAAAGAVAALAPTRPVLAVLDAGVPEAARAPYLAALEALFPVHRVLVPGGEAVKTWQSLGALLEEATRAGCGRQSVVFALGGGATCDVAALAASLLGRGAPVVLVPSTLLAQVDASVGGKCAVNLAAGRNLVGAFHPATDVLADVALLRSLREGAGGPGGRGARVYRSGLAELLKIGLIADPALFEEVAAAGAEVRVDAAQVARAVRAKAALVARDPFEAPGGVRQLLNLGHTLGHALESASRFTLEHGEAVAIGIAAIARFSAARGWLDAAELERIVGGLERVGLPIDAPVELLDESTKFITRDKKADAAGADLVVVHGLGRVSTKRVSSRELVDLVRYGGKG